MAQGTGKICLWTRDFLLDGQQGRQYELHERYLNPAFVKMIRTIGFDKNYVRGEGARGSSMPRATRYLDLLTGWGMLALGRNHPRVRSILERARRTDCASKVSPFDRYREEFGNPFPLGPE